MVGNGGNHINITLENVADQRLQGGGGGGEGGEGWAAIISASRFKNVTDHMLILVCYLTF
jgi:hypothetical protein